MELRLNPTDPHRTATEVGVVTAIAGAALLVAPGPVGRRSWLEDPRHAVAVGAADALIAAGLLLDRRRRARWLVARAAANVGTAALFARIARTGPPTVGPATVATALLAISLVDGGAARALAADERRRAKR